MARNCPITGGVFASDINLRRVAEIVTLTASNCRLLHDPSIKTISSQSMEYKYHHEHLKLLVRHMERFIVRRRVSTKAQRRATEMGIGDLSNYAWHAQTRKMKDPGRKIFHFEHVKPCAQIRDEILALENSDIDEIESILRTSDIAWILKTEKQFLDKKHKSYRADPYECFHDSGIELLD